MPFYSGKKLLFEQDKEYFNSFQENHCINENPMIEHDETKSMKILLQHWFSGKSYNAGYAFVYERIHFRMVQFPFKPEGKCIFSDDKNCIWQWEYNFPEYSTCINISLQKTGKYDVVQTLVFEKHCEKVDRKTSRFDNGDPWLRCLTMTEELVRNCKILNSASYLTNTAKKRNISKIVGKYVRKKLEELSKAHLKLHEKPTEMPENISISISNWYLPCDKVGAYIAPCKPWGFENWGVIVLSERALEDMDYLGAVLTHELIHATLNDACDPKVTNVHSGEFMDMADLVELAQEYRK